MPIIGNSSISYTTNMGFGLGMYLDYKTTAPQIKAVGSINYNRLNYGVEEKNTIVIFEITLSNLMSTGEIDEQDFMDRAKLLCSLGHTVMISNFQEYYRLVEYFSNYTKGKMALTMGVNNFVEIFNEKYYRNLSGGILEAFGRFFFEKTHNVFALEKELKIFFRFFERENNRKNC